MVYFYLLALALITIYSMLHKENLFNKLAFSTAMGDEDMKIAGENFSKTSKSSGEEIEADIKLFIQEKENRNIEKARMLGEKYVKLVMEFAKETGKECNAQSKYFHNQIVLLSYAVNRVITEKSPNSIVAQTVLNYFYTEIENSSSEIYKNVSDMGALSFYILSERSQKSSPADIGLVFAELCDQKDNPSYADLGSNLFAEFYKSCKEILENIGFVYS